MSENNNYSVEVTENFSLTKIFDCGQAFRFRQTDNEGEFVGVAFGRVLKLRQQENMLTLYDCTEDEYTEIWKDYFCMDTDYAEIDEIISTDDSIKEAIIYGKGIRILRQELWEMIITFIISQNNNIPRIGKLVEALCENYGRELELDGKIYYSFPTPEELSAATEEDLTEMKFGYRAGYITGFTKAVVDGSFSLDELNSLDTPAARKMLLSVKGIGGKVADCILLFGMGRYEVCPHDTWIKKALSEKYNIENVNERKGYELVTEKWGQYAGVAQQYLFYAQRYRK